MTKPWGGRRAGAGRPFRQRLKLSITGGRNLRLLVERWREARNNPTLREEDVVEELIQSALQQDVPPPQAE